MSSYRQLLYHLVFRPKFNRPALNDAHSGELYAYITGIIKNKDCFLYRINGIENHIHILTDIHPSIPLADFVRDVKVASSIWMKSGNLFPLFLGWSVGYGAFTCSYKDRDRIIEYIKNQKIHHAKQSLEDEYRSLLLEAGVTIDERYFP